MLAVIRACSRGADVSHEREIVNRQTLQQARKLVPSPDEAVDPDPQRPQPVAAAAEAPDRHIVLRVAVGPDAGQQRGQRQREQRGARQQRRRRGCPEEAARAAAEQREEVRNGDLRGSCLTSFCIFLKPHALSQSESRMSKSKL